MLKNFLNKIAGGNVLYFPGCLTKFALPEKAAQYEEILRKVGIEAISLSDYEVCCGSPPRMGGYKVDFEKLKMKNLEMLKNYSVKKVVSNCPTCVMMFRKLYDFEAEHITEIIWKNIKKFKSFESKFSGKTIYYHDPCHLGRKLGIYEQPRKILEFLGFKVLEGVDTREKSNCCGAGGGMKTNNPDLANKIARDYLSKVNAEYFTSPCPMCYAHFSENAPDKLKVLEFSDLFQ